MPRRSPDDDAFRFRHLLIRDAAYDALPKSARAELHERFAAWIEGRAPGARRARRDPRLPPRAGGGSAGRSSGRRHPALADGRGRRAVGRAAGARVDRDDARAGLRLLGGLSLSCRRGPPSSSPIKRYLGDWRSTSSASSKLQMRPLTDAMGSSGRGHRRERVLSPRLPPWAHAASTLSRGAGRPSAGTARRARSGRHASATRTLGQGYAALADFMHWIGRCQRRHRDRPARARARARGRATSSSKRTRPGHVGAGMFYGTTPFDECERHARFVIAQVDRFGANMHMRAQSGRPRRTSPRLQGRFDESREYFESTSRSMAERGRDASRSFRRRCQRGSAEIAAQRVRNGRRRFSGRDGTSSAGSAKAASARRRAPISPRRSSSWACSTRRFAILDEAAVDDVTGRLGHVTPTPRTCAASPPRPPETTNQPLALVAGGGGPRARREYVVTRADLLARPGPRAAWRQAAPRRHGRRSRQSLRLARPKGATVVREPTARAAQAV